MFGVALEDELASDYMIRAEHLAGLHQILMASVHIEIIVFREHPTFELTCTPAPPADELGLEPDIAAHVETVFSRAFFYFTSTDKEGLPVRRIHHHPGA